MQGFVHAVAQPRNETGGDLETPLPSLRMDSLTPSQLEVAAAFHLPLALAATPTRLQVHHFRGGQPYWAVEVSDLIKVPFKCNRAIQMGTDPREGLRFGDSRAGTFSNS
jgi:hypothetical protein